MALAPRSWAQESSDVVVETTRGKLRGASVRGVNVFKGVPYAASTAGQNRFLPPQPVAPWSGVRDALEYGSSAPQPAGHDNPLMSWYGAIRPVSEDCLFLNVFASATRTSPKPVMVWLHGGGWSQSAGTARGFEAFELVERGDVVVVTINHRLNLFGYLKLDDDDERFADSGNAGVLDMIAALAWVRDNAEVFGGDPHNVTIFGQSGGSSKVTALMATPAARGLFHKAIAQSCSGGLRVTGEEEAHALAHALAQQLGLPRATGAALQALPMDRLIATLSAAAIAYRPVLDGRTYHGHPFDPVAAASAAGIPFMAGNAATETRLNLAADPRNFFLEYDEARARISRFLQIDAVETNRIMDAYRSFYPSAGPSDLLATITTDYMYIRNTRRAGLMQSSQAPSYVYTFTWRTPVMDGLLQSPHASEVPFVFGTAPAAVAYVGSGPDIEPLTQMMIATWSSFAHRGDPNNALLPHWPRHEAHTRSVMMLSRDSNVDRDPGRQARAALDPLRFYEYSMPVNYPQR
jgi:para-nitrobenzyl esterase